jgi:hypothetical protein
MARRLTLVGLFLAAAFLLAISALVVWRIPIAQSALDWAAQEFEFPAARATVERLDLNRAAVSDLAAGERAELSVDSIEIAFQVPELAGGEIDSVDVAGPTLKLDLREGAAPLGSLQPLVDRHRQSSPKDSGAEAPPPRLPDLRLRDGRVEAETPYGPASLAFEGAFAGSRTGDRTLRLRGDLASAPARLSVELSASGDPQGQAEARLVISDGAVSLPDGLLELRELAGDLNVSLESGRPSAGHGALTAKGLTVAGTPFDQAGASFDLSRERAQLAARLGSDDGSFALDLEGRAERLDALPQFWLELHSEIRDDASLWVLSRPPFPDGGEGRLEVTAAGEFPDLPQITAGVGALRGWLTKGGVSGTASGTFSRLTLPESDAEAAAEVDLAAVWADGELSLATRQENRVAAKGITAEDLAGLGLPEDLAEQAVRVTGGNVSLSLPIPSQKPSVLVWRPNEPTRGVWFDGSAQVTAGPLSASLTGQAEAALGPAPALTRADLRDVAISATGLALKGVTIEDFDVTGRFAGDPLDFEADGEIRGRFSVTDMNGVSAESVSLRMPVELTRDSEAFDFRLVEPGALQVNGLAVPGLLRSEGPIDIALAGNDARLALGDETGVFALTHETRVGLGETALIVETEGGMAIPLRLRVPRIALAGELGEDGRYAGAATVREAALTLPTFDLAFEGLAADLDLPGDLTRAAADFEIAALRHTASLAAFAPLTVSGRAERSGDSLDLSALVTGPDGLELADIAATHDLATGSGQGEIELRDLRFRPGGLQPAALSPLLAALSEASGLVAGSAAVNWDGDGLAGSANLVIEGLSFTGKDLTVSGLDLSLALDSLQPPTSPPHQILRADLIDPGVPLTNLEVRFRLPPESPGQILIEDASFSTVGSRFALRDTLLNPAGERLETQLEVDQMDVAVLFDLLAVEGLSGSGELSGSIPIRRNGDIVTVADARLEALGPGVLRFRSDAARQALASGGEYVDLVIQALEDFRYETLVLTGNLDQDGETTMRLEILGHNPEVLEGHPFQLNINLTGNSTQILEAVVLSRALIGEIMARARRLSQ